MFPIPLVLQMQHWIQISFCYVIKNTTSALYVCLFLVLFRLCLFVFDFVNNPRAINLTFLARLFICFETWSGVAGFMFCFGLLSFLFFFGKNHCSHRVGFQLVCLLLSAEDGLGWYSVDHFFAFFTCLSGVIWSLPLHTHTLSCSRFYCVWWLNRRRYFKIVRLNVYLRRCVCVWASCLILKR